MQCSPPGTHRGAIDVLTKIVRNEVRPVTEIMSRATMTHRIDGHVLRVS